MTAQQSGGPDLLTQVHIAVIRLDAKVDQMREQYQDQQKKHLDHEARLRLLEVQHVSPDRVKALEDKPTVSPSTLQWVVGIIFTIAAVTVSIIGVASR